MRWAPYNYGFGFQADLITMLLEEGADYIEMTVTGSHFEKGSGARPRSTSGTSSPLAIPSSRYF